MKNNSNQSAFLDADFWQSIQNAARQEIAHTASQLIRARVVSVSGTKVNIRREYNDEADGIFYPLIDTLVVPEVGEYVWALKRKGGLVVLGRNLDASDKLASYLARSGGTLTGPLTVSEPTPRIRFNETDNEGAGGNYWIHVAGGIFHVLQDREGNGSWQSPHPFYIAPDGHVALGFEPEIPAHAATKRYVDAEIEAAIGAIPDPAPTVPVFREFQSYSPNWNRSEGYAPRGYHLAADGLVTLQGTFFRPEPPNSLPAQLAVIHAAARPASGETRNFVTGAAGNNNSGFALIQIESDGRIDLWGWTSLSGSAGRHVSLDGISYYP